MREGKRKAHPLTSAVRWLMTDLYQSIIPLDPRVQSNVSWHEFIMGS